MQSFWKLSQYSSLKNVSSAKKSFKETSLQILVFVSKLQEIPAFRLQMSGIKQKEYILPVYSFRKFKVKVNRYSSGFLPESFNWNASISGTPETKTRILILVQSFVSGSAQTLFQRAGYPVQS